MRVVLGVCEEHYESVSVDQERYRIRTFLTLRKAYDPNGMEMKLYGGKPLKGANGSFSGF